MFKQASNCEQICVWERSYQRMLNSEQLESGSIIQVRDEDDLYQVDDSGDRKKSMDWSTYFLSQRELVVDMQGGEKGIKNKNKVSGLSKWVNKVIIG